jgi:hypothetical protein
MVRGYVTTKNAKEFWREIGEQSLPNKIIF